MNRDLKHRQRKRRRRRTAPWKNWVENVVYGGKIRELSAGFLWTTNFPCKQRKCEWSKCSKCLFTVYPKRSIAPCLCSSRAAPSSFSVFFTSELFSSANFSCQLSLLELGLVRSLRKWFQWHFPLGFFRFMLGNQQGQSVFRGPFIDFEFRMIKATQVYRYPVPYISPFLTSIRMLVARIP